MNNILNRINKNVEKKTEKSVYDIDNLKKVKQDGKRRWIKNKAYMLYF